MGELSLELIILRETLCVCIASVRFFVGAYERSASKPALRALVKVDVEPIRAQAIFKRKAFESTSCSFLCGKLDYGFAS